MFTPERIPPRPILGIALALLLGVGIAGMADVANAQADTETARISDNASQGSYGYFRIVEGSATVVEAGSGTRSAAAVNQPVMPGDRVFVAERGRVEIVLSDRNLLRLDGGSEILLAQLAGTPDTNGRSTRLRLEEGNFQLVVVQDSLGDELPRVDTPNATVYIQYPGSYRITSDQGNWSGVVVRRGTAEVVTDRGSVRVRADEEAHVEGTENARTDVAQASGYDAVERWGRDLETQVAGNRGNGYLDERLSYAGAPLGRYGSWIEVNNQHYWRPTVEGGWRPFTDGYWTPTPSGLTWVATEPWGWVPYHYGSWDYLDGYGWVWAPGYVYSPAWVYWYWGPSQIGWCPVGYYTGWYGRHYRDPAFRHGVYGWAGGDWDLFGRWNFVDSHHFGHRDLGRWVRQGREGDERGKGHGRGGVQGDLRGDMRTAELPRGIITTDTRGITPGRWNHPDQVLNLLRNRAGNPLRGGGNLPDVTSFVARKPNLPPQVLRAVTDDTPDRGRFSGTPLRPVTLGTGPAGTAALDRGDRGDHGGRFGRNERNQPSIPPAAAATPHTWDRQAGVPREIPRTVPRPDAGNRAERPATHAWDRTGTPATPATPRGTPAPSPVEGQRNRWREVPAQPQAPRGQQPSQPNRGQRPEPAPRSTPPPPRYTPPPQSYSPPPPPRYNPPPAPRYSPPPPQQRQPERPAPQPPERPAQKPPEHHGH
ncbi:MAG: hypothetical protein QOJ16_223 [Acidobacteriota bacterium]|jgi:hypothetical protein|nr:hypothetical protein [Acidobacteriota bacterium]